VANIFQLYQYSNPLKEVNVLLLQENSNPFENLPEGKKYSNATDHQDSSTLSVESLFQNLDLTKMNFDEKFVPSIGPNKFGVIKKVFYFSKSMAIRTIEIENISNFIIEEVQEDMLRLIKLDWKKLNPIKGLYYDKSKIILMSDFLDDPNLDQYFINPPDLGINGEDPKMKIALEIAKTLQYMHENNVFHGHLSPNNIFIGKNQRVKIVDYGFRGLKKLISLQRGYANKSKYTAPEHLKEKTMIVKTFNQGSDIYSFGVIFWEILEGKKAFDHVNMKDLVVYVVEKQNRPKISEGINESLSKLIRACWQEEIEKRPSFKVICKMLEQNAT
jgi:serine/threonine protein kinase